MAKRAPEPDYRPAWRWVALLAAAAVLLIVVGAALGKASVVMLAIAPVSLIPVALLARAVRITFPRPRRHSASDTFLGGGMSLLGFSPTEQDEAASEAKLRREQQRKLERRRRI